MAAKKKNPPGFWPNEGQVLLLEAALLEENRAYKSFKSWRSSNDLENMDEGSYRLIPLIYNNLVGLAINDPIFINFKEIYLNYWTMNERMFRHVSQIVNNICDDGIEVTLLKGMPLILNYYKDSGLRPMGDIDILVPKDDFLKVIASLKSEGWHTDFDHQTLADIQSYFHAVNFINNETHLDLHWQVIPSIDQNIFQKNIWDINHFGLESNSLLKVLAPTDELFYICIHGARFNRIPSIRWVTDAYYILKKNKENINWERFIDLAIKTSRTNETRDTLLFLKSVFDLPIPETAIDLEANKQSVSPIKYYLLTHPTPIFWDLFNKYFYYRDFNNEDDLWMWSKQFYTYLKITWGIKRNQNIFLFMIKILLLRIYYDLFTSPYFSRKQHLVIKQEKD